MCARRVPHSREGTGRVGHGADGSSQRGACLVVMAEDVNPSELLAHIPMICKEKSIPFMYVPDQAYLAEAAGMSDGTKTAAVAVVDVKKDGEDRFNEVKGHYETLSA